MKIPAQQSNARTTPEEKVFQLHRAPDNILTGEPYLETPFDPFLQFPSNTQDLQDIFVLQNFQPSSLAWPLSFQPEIYEPVITNWRYPLVCQPFTEQQSTTVYPVPTTDPILNSHQINHTQIYPNVLPSLHQNDAPFTIMEGTVQYSETSAAKPTKSRKKETETETTGRGSGKRSRIKNEPTVDQKIQVKPEVKYDGDEVSKANKKQRVAAKFWSVEEDKAMLDGVMEAMHGKWTIVAQHPDLANRDANRCTMRMKSIINRALKTPDRKE